MGLEDEEACALLRQVADGDQQALSVFYKAHARTVYAFALRSLSDPVAAEEIVVEVMYEVWKNASRFAGHAKASTWLLGIARHKALDRMRSRYVHRHDELDDEMPSNADAPEISIMDQQTRSEIERCMKKLPQEQREAIHLVFYEEMGLAAIAQIQDCPENTVKTRVFHARQKLRRCLERFVKEEINND